jgi:hypothetical protein
VGEGSGFESEINGLGVADAELEDDGVGLRLRTALGPGLPLHEIASRVVAATRTPPRMPVKRTAARTVTKTDWT